MARSACNRNLDEKGLLTSWPAEGPKLVWQASDIGSGYSTPAVVGERIYLISNEGTENEFVAALERKTPSESGRRGWVMLGRTRVRNIPVLVLRRRSTANCSLHWARTATWHASRRPAARSAGRKICAPILAASPAWAYAESPLIDGDVLVCTPGGAEATFVALDKRSGDVIWKSALAEADQAGYASAITVEADGVKQYVQFLQKGLVGVDAKTGKFLWRDERTARAAPRIFPRRLPATA